MTMEMSLKSLSPIGMPTRTWTRPLYWLLDLLGASNLVLDMDVLCGIDEELGMHDRWSNAKGGCRSGDRIPNGVQLGTLSSLAHALNSSQLFNAFAHYI